MSKKLAVLGASLAFAALVAPSLTFASALTSSQVNAIIGLLQSFGANSSTIASVETALTGNGAPTTAACVTLSQNLTLGDTDASTNGAVTKLQTFLQNKGYFTYQGAKGYYGMITADAVGQYQLAQHLVSSRNDAAFGITGAQTRSTMSCGNSAQPQPQPNASFTATSTSGAAPLTVSFGTSGARAENGSIDFGDGSSLRLLTLFGNGPSNSAGFCGAMPDFFCSVPHTYAQAGTYTASLKDSSGNVFGTKTITVTGSQASQPTAAIDQSSLTTSSLTPTISGTSNASSVRLVITNPNSPTAADLYESNFVSVENGRWSITVSPPSAQSYYEQLIPGSYPIEIDGSDFETLANGTLTITDSQTSGQNQPTAAIDQSSLTGGSCLNSTGVLASRVISGTASGVTEVTVDVAGGGEIVSSTKAPVVNGRYSTITSPMGTDGGWTVTVFGLGPNGSPGVNEARATGVLQSCTSS